LNQESVIKNARILLVEDNRDLAETVGAFLQGQLFSMDFAADGVTALHLVLTESYDAIVLDLNLPGMDGIEICRRLRQEAKKRTPVIMLTARDQLADKLEGFDVGADDYLVKPFELQELAVRIEALVRRERGEVSQAIYEIADLKLDRARQIAMRGRTRLKLSPRSFEILSVLMRQSPAIVTRGDLEREIWGDDLPDSDSLRSHIYNLRRIVDKPFEKALIETSTGRGFRIVDPDEGD